MSRTLVKYVSFLFGVLILPVGIALMVLIPAKIICTVLFSIIGLIFALLVAFALIELGKMAQFLALDWYDERHKESSDGS